MSRADPSAMADEPQAVEYRAEHHQLNTVARLAKFDDALAAMAADGWRIHTFDTSSHPDVDLLWHRPAAYGSRLQELQAELARVTAERDELRAALSAQPPGAS